MGRNPFYAEHIRPLKNRPVIQDLDDIFCYLFAVGDISNFDELQVAYLGEWDDLYLRLIQCEYLPTPVLERSCSIYRKQEDRFPEMSSIYKVKSATHYKFRNQHSLQEPFVYNVLEVVNIDDECYTTFCLRTDGAILNVESLSLRGYVNKVMVASSIEQLRDE